MSSGIRGDRQPDHRRSDDDQDAAAAPVADAADEGPQQHRGECEGAHHEADREARGSKWAFDVAGERRDDHTDREEVGKGREGDEQKDRCDKARANALGRFFLGSQDILHRRGRL
jgi:hypothetical protein